MEVYEHKIPTEGPFTLAPIGDIQYGAGGCDVDKLRRHIEYGIEHGWYFLGMGDYLDAASPSNREALRVARLYESTRDIIDDGIYDKTRELAEILKAEGRWIAMVRGDHTHTFADGQPSDHLLSRKLQSHYLGTAGFLRIRVAGMKTPLRVWMFHGKKTSGTNPTGLTLEFERLKARFEADLYLMGHAHANYAYRTDRLFAYREGKNFGIGHRDVVCAVTGSFLNGWSYGSRDSHGYPEGGYVEKGGLAPLPTGAPIINVTPTVKHGTELYELRGVA